MSRSSFRRASTLRKGPLLWLGTPFLATSLIAAYGAVTSATSGSVVTPTISVVGTLATGTGTHLAFSPQAKGDLIVLTVSANNSAPPTVSTVSGGGVTNWSLAKRLNAVSGRCRHHRCCPNCRDVDGLFQ
jgi:hypothetical protein